MRHAGMNNFTAIDIHTLTNGKSYGNVGNGFISFQLFENGCQIGILGLNEKYLWITQS